MADYKELLRRAVEALPENNGAARRAVYEKARAALVGQLRAIQPPLPARDITAHRLQLEDCIRQVEQEASEAVIAGMGRMAELPPPADMAPEKPRPAQERAASERQAQPNGGGRPAAARAAAPKAGTKSAPKALPPGETIEDIIRAANADAAPADEEGPRRADLASSEIRIPSAPRQAASRQIAPHLRAVASPVEESDEAEDEGEPEVIPPKPAGRPSRPLPAIVARAEAARGRSASTAFNAPQRDKPYDAPARRGPVIEPRPEPVFSPRGQAATARQPVLAPVDEEDVRVAAAMSAVREVEVEPVPVDPQGAIDRAIATLDREARGEPGDEDGVDEVDVEDDGRNHPPPNGKAGAISGLLARAGRAPKPKNTGRDAPARNSLAGKSGMAGTNGRAALSAPAREPRGRGREDQGGDFAFPRARPERERGGAGAVAIFLVVFAVLLAGAGGAGYWAYTQGYLDFSTMLQPAALVEAEAETPVPEAPPAAVAAADPATGPGNTAVPTARPQAATELAASDERLTPEPSLSGEPVQPLALAAPAGGAAAEERLSTDAAEAAADAVAAVDPARAAGSQSLLLEASDNGTTGAVPYSGTVEWSRGTDEMGQPTLVGKANIPARNLGVDVLIRKNADPSLPASHLMEINFRVSDGFIGGSIAGLPGVLLKNEELVQGTPLVGASARVVGNSFLFALSAAQADLTNNSALLTDRKWIDLALIYATGKRAIITLEKDQAADALFREVFAAWTATASAE